MTSTQSSKYGLRYRNLKNSGYKGDGRLPFNFNREVASSFRLVVILGLSAFVSSSALSQESASPQVEKFPPKSNSVDRKTTEEGLVNPVALSEKTPLGWQTGFIGAFRGTFDLSIGVKFSPERTQFRNVIFGGTLELAPGIRARANFRRREGEAKAFKIDADEIYLEVYNQYRTLNWNATASLRVGAVRYLHTPYPETQFRFSILSLA